MNDCLFCKIINGDIPSSKVFENEFVYAFDDINPEAPVHIVIVPKIHIENLNDVSENNSKYLEEIMKAVNLIAEKKGIKESGYRLISNAGIDAGQSVMHLHFHLVGGKKLGEKIL